MRKVLFLLLCLGTAIAALVFFRWSLNSKTPAVAPKTVEEKKEKIRIIDLENIREKDLMSNVISACPQITSNTGVGTGFLFINTKIIATALHVIDKDTWVYADFSKLSDNGNELETVMRTRGTVIGWSNANYDIAFILVEEIPNGVVPLMPATNESLASEQPAWRFGYNKHYKWSQGIYAPTDDNASEIIVTMPAGPGGSGGPLVDGQGRVLGIFQTYNDSDNELVTDSELKRSIEFHPIKAHFLAVPYITMWFNAQNIQ